MRCAYSAIDDSIVLTYSNLDDGVWLECACGWTTNLGFRATPQKAMEEVAAHKATTAADQILEIVAELYDSPDNDRYGSIVDRLIAAEDIRRATS